MKKYIIFLFSLILLSCSPSSQQEDYVIDGAKLYTLDVNSLDTEGVDVPLSELLESFEVVKLDNSPEAFSQIYNVNIDEDFIWMQMRPTPLKLFTREGKFLGNRGAVGQGPGEYFAVMHSAVVSEWNRLYIASQHTNQILTYELKSGKFLPDECIPLPEKCIFPQFYFDVEKKLVTVFLLPAKAKTSNENFKNASKNLCWVQDMKGHVIQSVPAEPYALRPSMSNRLYTTCYPVGDSTVFSFSFRDLYANRQDTLYHYDVVNNKVIPCFTTNIMLERLKICHSAETPLDYYVHYTKFRDGTSPNPENVEKSTCIQVSKKTGKARYVRKFINDYWGGMEIETCDFFELLAGNYIWYTYEPLGLKEALERFLKEKQSLDASKRKELTHLKDGLRENDNNIMWIGKFKQK